MSIDTFLLSSDTTDLNYPKVRPTLDLNFARVKTLDPRITFTRASGGSYVGADGLIKYAGVNEARFDHNPTSGESLGLLVEEARTNLALYSEQFDNAYWSKIRTTATSNVIAAPDGTITADQIDHQSQSGDWSIIFRSALGAAGSNVFTIYLRCAAGQTVANYKLSAGGTISTITVTDQWQRFSLSYSGTQDVRMGNYIPESSPARTVYAWGAQLEAGAFPTSYIPTTTTTVTRSADVASITGSNFSSWYNQNAGTFYSKGDLTYGTVTSFRRLLAVNNGRFSWNMIEGINVFKEDGSGARGAFYTGLSPNTPFKYHIAESVDNTIPGAVSLVASGVIKTLEQPGSTLPAASALSIGTNKFTGRIARLTYYPVRLPDATLQTLTR
jgi:hypothetical protein